MKAVVINKVTPANQVKISEIPKPVVKPGWVLIKVKAFGMNHSEQLVRLEEINESYIKKPVVPGIECVGIVEDTTNESHFKKGDKVIALMGGMGRSFNGSYEEYALLPEKQVFTIKSNLSFAELAAIPETYFTAWGSLFESLQLKPEDTLLIRGATSALGYASIQLAKALGSKVVATTHKECKLNLIDSADKQILDDGHLTKRVTGITKALDLVGPKFLADTLTAVEEGAIVCNTGILGGVYTLNNFDPIKDIPNNVYLTGFFSNYPTQKIIDDIFAFMNKHELHPLIGKQFKFDDIRDACIAMDNGKINGKIVITLD